MKNKGIINNAIKLSVSNPLKIANASSPITPIPLNT
jgi:hypothetical protein